MIFHVPEVAVALLVIAMSVQEIILGQLEDNSEEYQQLSHYLFMNMASKFLNFLTVFSDDFGMGTLIYRKVLWDVVDLCPAVRQICSPRIDCFPSLSTSPTMHTYQYYQKRRGGPPLGCFQQRSRA